ncbi:transmembrane protein 70, mitochondrial [Cololabis saira]|uniref:transmembrane protein 70, mitochondrial n=1 Tax=Cololabis saira TaxID=129043 RepID=UPI002AD2C690|nr:transmembrane protein 70, mitochondrial [Cololabis saira]
MLLRLGASGPGLVLVPRLLLRSRGPGPGPGPGLVLGPGPVLSPAGPPTRGAAHALHSLAWCTGAHAHRRAVLSWRQVPSVRPSVRPTPRLLSSTSNGDDGNLIYTGNLAGSVRGVKLFSYSTSAASLALLPQILLQTGLGVQSPALQATFITVVGFFTFLTPVLLHLVTRGYVLRLYHHPARDTYTAVTCSVLLTERRRVFHQDRVRVPAVSRMFTSFYAGGAGYLVNPDLFQLPQDYNHLMGYDKPFSFPPEDLEPPERS